MSSRLSRSCLQWHAHVMMDDGRSRRLAPQSSFVDAVRGKADAQLRHGQAATILSGSRARGAGAVGMATARREHAEFSRDDDRSFDAATCSGCRAFDGVREPEAQMHRLAAARWRRCALAAGCPTLRVSFTLSRVSSGTLVAVCTGCRVFGGACELEAQTRRPAVAPFVATCVGCRASDGVCELEDPMHRLAAAR